MKKSKSYQLTLREKINLGLTLAVLMIIGLFFFYINGLAILELLHIDPKIISNTLIKASYVLLIATGLWLVLPIKIRISIEAIFYSRARIRSKFLSTDTNYYPTLLATKLPPNLVIRLIGIILIILGFIIYKIS